MTNIDAERELDSLLKYGINKLSDIQEELVATFGFEQWEINLAIKSKLDEGYTVIQQKNEDYLVQV